MHELKREPGVGWRNGKQTRQNLGVPFKTYTKMFELFQAWKASHKKWRSAGFTLADLVNICEKYFFLLLLRNRIEPGRFELLYTYCFISLFSYNYSCFNIWYPILNTVFTRV